MKCFFNPLTLHLSYLLEVKRAKIKDVTMMKKITVFTLILVGVHPVNCWGEWSYIVEQPITSEQIYTVETEYYVDYQTVKKKGEYVYFWELVNFSKPASIKSVKGRIKLDCEASRILRLNRIFYSQPMGKGVPTNNLNPNFKWENLSPDSAYATVAKNLCELNW